MNINLSYFFNPMTFPWHLSGIDRPSYGKPYSYVCKIMAPLAGQDSNFLKGNPTLSEMSRFPDNTIIHDIHRYFTQLENGKDSFNIEALDRQIIYYLSNSQEFRDLLHNRLVIEHLRGNELPEAAVFSYTTESQYVGY